MIAVVMLAAAVALAGCAAEGTSPEIGRVPVNDTQVLDGRVLQGNLLTFRYYSGLTQRERMVVRTEEEWARLWERITQRVSPPIPRPSVDFSREMVLVVAMGERPTGGYTIVVEGIVQADRHLHAMIRESSPDGCGVTGALTQPIDVVRVPRRDGGVSFIERETVGC